MAETSDPGTSTENDIAIFTAAAAQVRANAWVCQIVGYDLIPREGSVEEAARVAIALPWPLAKVIAQTLQHAIETYEKVEGEISVPKRVQEAMKKMGAGGVQG